MEFFTLSLTESLFLYLGLAIQALLRATALRFAPGGIALIWWGILLLRAMRRREDVMAPITYPFIVVLILLLFFPDRLIFSRGGNRSLSPEQVSSYAASQDPQAEIRSAADTRQVPPTLQTPILLPPGTRLLLRLVTDTPLALARMINSQAHRPFASLMPMHWLLGTELTADVTPAIADFVHSCYLPVLTTVLATGQGRTVQELLPWGDSPISQALARRTVVPAANTGISFVRSNTSDPTVPCPVYLQAVQGRTESWLFDLKSPGGAPLSHVFQEELGLDIQRQGQFLIYREMLRAAGPAVPAPSLAGTYAAIRGAGVVGKALTGAAQGGLTGWLSGAGAAATALLGGSTGGTGGLGAEFQRMIDGLSWLVGLAVFLTWWGPYIIGIINMVLLAMLPFVALGSLTPHHHFTTWMSYVRVLWFTNSSPLWWALADQVAKLTAGTAPQSQDLILGLGNNVVAFGWSTMGIALAVLLIPAVLAAVFTARVWSAVNLMRGGV